MEPICANGTRDSGTPKFTSLEFCVLFTHTDRFSHVLHGKQPCSYLFSAENLERGMNYLMGLIENDPVPFIRQVTLV